jgi:exodeoxyribonuclease V alpha subunit
MAKRASAALTVSGEVVWVFYSSPSFSAGLLQSGTERLRFSVKAPVREHDHVTMTGRMVTGKYGPQLEVSELRYQLELDAQGLARYLAVNPAFHGIGPVKAEQIAVMFGTEFDRVLREEPQRIADAVKLSGDDLDTLQREWTARSTMNALSSRLAAYGLTHHQMTKLIERFGGSAMTMIEHDPYAMCDLVDGFGFARVDEIAIKMGVAKEDPRRIAAGITDVVTRETEQGHCWISREELLRKAEEKLTLDDLDADERLQAALLEEVHATHLVMVEDNAITRVGLTSLYQRERDLYEMFRGLPDEKPATFHVGTLDSLLELLDYSLTKAQHTAVYRALNSRISLITGAAGSGKSYTIAALCDVMKERNRRVLLAAPTGKAAKRMEELSGTRAATIHRLLGYKRGEWEYHAGHPLVADMVILDEMSMADINLAWHFFQAIDLTKTQVVLVGDPNQLPPVGPGNLLRDALQCAYLPVLQLEQVIRQAGPLKENSSAILRGTLAPTTPGTPGVVRPWYVIDGLTDPERVVEALIKLIEEKIVSLGFHPLHDVQVLTPYRKGPLGVQRLNLELQRALQRMTRNVQLPEVTEESRPCLLPGDKVMQMRNNYDLDLMNGAIGIVRGEGVIESDGAKQRGIVVAFDGRDICIPRGGDEERQLSLAYATTIHKAQGSEFPCAIAIVHRQHAYMLHRNLLYTAVTRAQKTAILFGDRVGMRRAVTTTVVDERRTWLGVWAPPRQRARAQQRSAKTPGNRQG